MEKTEKENGGKRSSKEEEEEYQSESVPSSVDMSISYEIQTVEWRL